MPPVPINCYVCQNALPPRAMVRIAQPENEEKRQIAVRRRSENVNVPEEVNNETRICLNCNLSIVAEIRELQNDPHCLRLNVLKQNRNGSCMFCNGHVGVSRLSNECRAYIFIKKNIYAPDWARCCNQHTYNNGLIPNDLLDGIQSFERPYRLSGRKLLLFLQSLRNTCADKIDAPDFDNEESFTEEEFSAVSPITRENFQNMYTYCVPVPDMVGDRRVYRRVSKKDLLLFLCKLRQGLSDDFLKVIFQYSSRQNVSLIISIVRRSLMANFVPSNLGLRAITREQYIQAHVTDFTNELYNPEPENRKAIVYIDGTYVYIHKPTNFRALRQTYSVHKGRHLIKPALLVAPNGYILDIHGPYFADSRNNDAAMLRNEFEADANGLREWLQNDDIVICDRGYRDVVPLLEHLGIDCKMPALLGPGQRQFTTEEANETRKLTKTRCIVEIRNGHIKTVFKFFGNMVSTVHAINIGDFFRIAAAILNKYRDTIQMQGANIELAQEMLRRSREPNLLKIRVERENLHTRNARWIRLTEQQVLNFPLLETEYLEDLTVGIYQINLAPAYIQDKLDRERAEELELDELINEPGLIRVRVYSRFRNATKYQLWISYNPQNRQLNPNEEDGIEEPNDNPIKGYYCTCKCGARTLGTCAHVASVVWFLGHGRHQPNVKYPTTSVLENIQDAGQRQ